MVSRQARRRGQGGSLSSRRNTADDRPDSRPEGAKLASRLGVAPLGKGRAIPCAARSQVGSE